MNNPKSIFKSRDITLPIKVHLVKAMVFLVVTCGCETNKGKRRVHTHTMDTHTHTHTHTHTMHSHAPSTGPDLYFYIKVSALM